MIYDGLYPRSGSQVSGSVVPRLQAQVGSVICLGFAFALFIAVVDDRLSARCFVPLRHGLQPGPDGVLHLGRYCQVN